MSSTKSGFMELRDVRISEGTVSPGSQITVEADVANTAYAIPRWDKDNANNSNNPCNGGIFTHAYCYKVIVKGPSGSITSSGPLTIGTTEIGAVNNTVKIQGVPGQDSGGEYNYKAKIRMSGSGMESGWEKATVNVESDSSGGSGYDPGLPPWLGGGGTYPWVGGGGGGSGDLPSVAVLGVTVNDKRVGLDEEVGFTVEYSNNTDSEVTKEVEMSSGGMEISTVEVTIPAAETVEYKYRLVPSSVGLSQGEKTLEVSIGSSTRMDTFTVNGNGEDDDNSEPGDPDGDDEDGDDDDNGSLLGGLTKNEKMLAGMGVLGGAAILSKKRGGK